MAGLYIESGIWGLLWHRVAQMLQVHNPDSDLPIHDIEAEGDSATRVIMPDWNLICFQGLLGVLQMAVAVFTRVRFNVYSFVV